MGFGNTSLSRFDNTNSLEKLRIFLYDFERSKCIMPFVLNRKHCVLNTGQIIHYINNDKLKNFPKKILNQLNYKH